MSSWGRATDLLADWKAHPEGCTAMHGWGDDGSLMHGTNASAVLEQVLEALRTEAGGHESTCDVCGRPARCSTELLEGMLIEARRFGAEMELLAEQRAERIGQLEVRVGQLTAAHFVAERLRAEAGGRPE